MGLRFRKSIKLAPGIRMNLGLSGLSMSMGPRDASVSVGKRGVYGNVGIPGTGLSARQKVSGLASRRTSRDDLAGLRVTFNLQADGTVDIVGTDGSALPPVAVKMAREQN